MKIVYLGINASYSHSSLSFGMIKSYTSSKLATPSACDWHLYEATINDDYLSICNDLEYLQPDIILTTFYLFNHNFLLKVLKCLKLIQPQVLIYVGGPEFLGDNETWLLANREIDGVIRGDESSLYQILDNLCNPHIHSNIKGLCYLSPTGEYIDNGYAELQEDLDSLPCPYDPEMFRKTHPFYQLETSRGCYGNCTFCTSALSTVVKRYSLETVSNNLAILYAHKIREFRVLDRTFNESSAAALDLLALFTSSYPDCNFHLEVNPAKLTKTFLTSLQSAPDGQYHLEIGVQSLKDNVLKAIKRPANSAKTLAGIEALCQIESIDIHVDLIAGLPEQTVEDIIDDLNLLITSQPAEIQLEVLKILPGTPITEHVDKYGIKWNPLPPYEVVQTHTLSLDNLMLIRIQSAIIDSYYNTAKLKTLYTFACLNIPDFINQFLIFYSSQQLPLIKKSLKNRFLIFDNFAQQHSAHVLQEQVRFSWLAAGFSIEKYNIKSHKCQALMEGDCMIWQNPENNTPKREFSVDFAYNCGEIWLDPTTEPKQQSSSYRFYQALGNVMAVICRKDS